MKRIQKKYANDRQRQAQEMQKLQREHGVNPLGGCLPMLLQIPVFIGLNHVLRSFRVGTNEVYFFHGADVRSYLDAKLFGVHLGDSVLGIGSLGGSPGWHWEVAPVAIPLMIAAAVATHFTARLSVQRQAAMGTPATSQTAMMNKLTLYIFPLGVLVFGGGFPIGLLLYWLSNNGWTLGQQHFVMKKIDAEEQEKKEQAIEARNALAPKPGQKPVATRKRPANQPKTDVVEDEVPVADAVPVEDAKPTQRTQNGKAAQRRPQARDPRRAVKPSVPNPTPNRGNGGKPAAQQKDSTPANGKASTEIPGLISDRPRRKKQDRKRG
jgi:YidC/Oxa1 family membrane protein insertase